MTATLLNTKIKFPAADKGAPPEERVASSMPDPRGYKILIALPDVLKKTDGGIILAEKFEEAKNTASIVGFVLKLGSLAYYDVDKFPDGPWCKEGDWVLFRAYSGTRIMVHGKEFRIINDDTVEAVVEDPRGVSRV